MEEPGASANTRSLSQLWSRDAPPAAAKSASPAPRIRTDAPADEQAEAASPAQHPGSIPWLYRVISWVDEHRPSTLVPERPFGAQSFTAPNSSRTLPTAAPPQPQMPKPLTPPTPAMLTTQAPAQLSLVQLLSQPPGPKTHPYRRLGGSTVATTGGERAPAAVASATAAEEVVFSFEAAQPSRPSTAELARAAGAAVAEEDAEVEAEAEADDELEIEEFADAAELASATALSQRRAERRAASRPAPGASGSYAPDCASTAVGTHVRIYWEGDARWYSGKITVRMRQRRPLALFSLVRRAVPLALALALKRSHTRPPAGVLLHVGATPDHVRRRRPRMGASRIAPVLLGAARGPGWGAWAARGAIGCGPRFSI